MADVLFLVCWFVCVIGVRAFVFFLLRCGLVCC